MSPAPANSVVIGAGLQASPLPMMPFRRGRQELEARGYPLPYPRDQLVLRRGVG